MRTSFMAFWQSGHIGATGKSFCMKKQSRPATKLHATQTTDAASGLRRLNVPFGPSRACPSRAGQREANRSCANDLEHERDAWSSLAGFEPRLPAYEADALPLKLLRLKFSNTRRGHSYFSGNGDRRTVTGEG